MPFVSCLPYDMWCRLLFLFHFCHLSDSWISKLLIHPPADVAQDRKTLHALGRFVIRHIGPVRGFMVVSVIIQAQTNATKVNDSDAQVFDATSA